MPVLDNEDPGEGGEREHIFDARGACWCSPELEHICRNGARVWVHRVPDGSMPPLEVIAEAIARAAFNEDEQ